MAEGRSWYAQPTHAEFLDWQPVLQRAGVRALTRACRAGLPRARRPRAGARGPVERRPVAERGRPVEPLGGPVRPQGAPPGRALEDLRALRGLELPDKGSRGRVESAPMARKKRKSPLRPRVPARVKKAGKKSQRGHHHPELWGLVLAAVGIFLATLFWFGWEGGVVGGPVEDGLRGAIGAAAYVAPAALFVLGLLMVSRSELVDVSPFRTGLIVLSLGLLLALGADHGGLVGRALEGVVGSSSARPARRSSASRRSSSARCCSPARRPGRCSEDRDARCGALHEPPAAHGARGPPGAAARPRAARAAVDVLHDYPVTCRRGASRSSTTSRRRRRS